MKTFDWIVVGSGITGAALAYELLKTGFTVLLLEQSRVPKNATRYSYGGLAYWSGTTPMTQAICQEAIALYQNLPSELDADIEFRELDLLLTISTDDDPEVIPASYTRVATSPRLLSRQEACELEPLLNPEAVAGALTIKHGHIHPGKTTQAYIQAFLRAGGEIQIAQVVDIFKQPFIGANIVICAGGLSRQLLKSSGIAIKLYFSHAEMIETPPVDLRLSTLVMPANVQRFHIEAESTQDDQLWDELGHQPVASILDVGAVQFLDGSLRLGQVTRILTDPYAQCNLDESERWLRTKIAHNLPALGNLPGTCYHCLVGFSSDHLPLIGAVPEYQGIHVFSGFSNPLVFAPPLAVRFANFAAGNQDEIISQLSPRRWEGTGEF